MQREMFLWLETKAHAEALETSVTADGFVKPNRGWTDKFIYPPYDFKITREAYHKFPIHPNLRY